MSLKIGFKIVTLLTALTATIVAIFLLKAGHMNAFWTSLGIKTGTRLNWCEERVSEMFIFDNNGKVQASLLEKDGQWIWNQAGNDQPLDYIKVEKWFAKYCQVDFEAVEAVPGMPSQVLTEAKFLDGNRITIAQITNSAFRIRDQYFRSETLQQGLKELLAFGPKMK